MADAATNELERVERLLANPSVVARLPDKGEKLRKRAATLREVVAGSTVVAGADDAPRPRGPPQSIQDFMAQGPPRAATDETTAGGAAEPDPTAPPPSSSDVASAPSTSRGASASGVQRAASQPQPVQAIVERHADERVDVKALFQRQYAGVLSQAEIDKMVADCPAMPSYNESQVLLHEEARRERLRELERLRLEAGTVRRVAPPPPHPRGAIDVSAAGLVTHARQTPAA